MLLVNIYHNDKYLTFNYRIKQILIDSDTTQLISKLSKYYLNEENFIIIA